jgi:hypothetical protein
VTVEYRGVAFGGWLCALKRQYRGSQSLAILGFGESRSDDRLPVPHLNAKRRRQFRVVQLHGYDRSFRLQCDGEFSATHARVDRLSGDEEDEGAAVFDCGRQLLGPFPSGIDAFVVINASAAGGEEFDLPFDPDLVAVRIADEDKRFRTAVGRRSGRG